MRDALGCAKLSWFQERLEDAKPLPGYADSLDLLSFSKSRFQISGRLARQGRAFS